MDYLVYRTENKINSKFYYGVHNGSKDWYLGSGKMLKVAIDKYGKENFVRRTIAKFKTEEEAYAFESIMVDKTLINDPNCYNITTGGNKPPTSYGHNYGKSIAKGRKGVKHKPHTKQARENCRAGIKTHTCPHCNKEGKGNIMFYFHFENCKLNNRKHGKKQGIHR